MSRPRVFHLSVAASVAALAIVLDAGPQEPAGQQPVFRGRTETVAIYATAIDRYGEMVRDLTRDDFVVEDEGRRQDLTVFENGMQPITAALLVDTSASMTLNLDLARAAAEQFVIRMEPGDKVRVGTFSDKITLNETFTSDRDELLRAFRANFDVGNPTRLWDAVSDSAKELAPLGGRRIIMVMTDGVDTLSSERQGDVLDFLQEQELMVYIVQFRANQRGVAAELAQPSAKKAFEDPRRRNVAPTQGLRQIAAETGGGHFQLNRYDDVNATFTRVMQELHWQYVLGFTPQRRDGKLHDLKVTVKKPDVTLRARQHYRAALPEPATR
jgi:Ca-activated chloride channel homolog